MVTTFRSLTQPLVLLVSVPFAATGVLGMLLVTETPLGVPALIGLLMLVGIVVTNAIVLIDLVNQHRRRGLPVTEAVIGRARYRLRPILMTAAATIGALIPMSLGRTGGSVFISQPLALVVIGGLPTSTLLTSCWSRYCTTSSAERAAGASTETTGPEGSRPETDSPLPQLRHPGRHVSAVRRLSPTSPTPGRSLQRVTGAAQRKHRPRRKTLVDPDATDLGDEPGELRLQTLGARVGERRRHRGPEDGRPRGTDHELTLLSAVP